jgi:hypothetical protein
MTLKFSIAVVWQLAALKGSAGAQFYLFGHTVVFQPSISCALRLQVRLSWILGVFHFLTYFVRHRPNEIIESGKFNEICIWLCIRHFRRGVSEKIELHFSPYLKYSVYVTEKQQKL